MTVLCTNTATLDLETRARVQLTDSCGYVHAVAI